MNSSTIERAAYIAAHRIIQADLSSPQFACPGTRRSKMVDAIAGIIKDVMEAEPDSDDGYIGFMSELAMDAAERAR